MADVEQLAAKVEAARRVQAGALTQIGSPLAYLLRMLVFLALAGLIAFILFSDIKRAFMANPGLNGLILGVLAVGIILALSSLGRLFSAARWANDWTPGASSAPAPGLLSPLANLVGAEGRLTPHGLKAALDSAATRLDEHREILRYLAGLLVFLGLLGTFWGLLDTVAAIGDVVKAMKGGADSLALFEDLKAGIAKPLAGMSLSFTASLFGLAGSLILGFLDLQVGQAQNRFYADLEDRLTLMVDSRSLAARPDYAPPESSAAMASLAEGVQALVQHMRAEQQMVRNWLEAQADQNQRIRRALERLVEGQEKR